MNKTNVKESNRKISNGTNIVTTESFLFDDDENDIDEKIKKLEENMKKLEELETTETLLDNQYKDDQQDLNDIETDNNNDNEVELQKEQQSIQKIKNARESSLFFESESDKQNDKNSKTDLDFEIENKLKLLAELKKKKQLLELDREINETEKETETPGFFGSIFKEKTEEELMRENSKLNRKLKIAELNSEIIKKQEILKNNSRTSSAKNFLSELKKEFFDTPQEKLNKKQNKNKKPSSDGLKEFLFG